MSLPTKNAPASIPNRYGTTQHARLGSRRRPGRVRLITAFVIVVLLLEGSARLIAPRFEVPLRWYHWRAQLLVEAMESERVAGRSSDLVFAGNSSVGHLMNMPMFARELSTVDTAHSVALPSAGARLLEHWILGEVVPRLHPARVVLGLTSQDVNDGRMDPAIDRYLEAPESKPGLVAAIERFLSRNSMLARHRVNLRSPQKVLDALSADRSLEREPAAENALTPTAPDNFNKTKRELRRIKRGALFDFRVGTTALAALGSILEGLMRQGIEVVVVFVPMPPSYREAHPRGERDFRTAIDAMRGTATAVGVPVFDFSDALPEDAFKDYTHVWHREAAPFSKLLSAELSRLGW